MPVRPGTDVALFLGVCRILIEENKYDADFVRQFTDLPLLVRTDNQLFLRESDMEEGGSEEVFYVFDEASGQVRPMSNTTLALEGLRPALEGEFSVTALDGEVKVSPVFAMLHEQLKACRLYTYPSPRD